MLVTVIGVRKVDFKAQDGNEIKGTKVFIEYPDAVATNHKGVIAVSIFIIVK